MARDSGGNYSLPAGNPVVSGETITSSWANTTMDDIEAEITNSLDRSGRGGMTGVFKAVAGTVSLPGIVFSAELTSGLYRAGTNDIRMAIAAADILRFNASGIQVYLSAAWHGVWHAGNDGATSGLDADLLDGQEGSFYTNADNLAAGTLPDARFPATLPAASGVNLTSLNGSNIASGTVSANRLGSGTPSASNFLRGDGSWQATPGGVSDLDGLSDVTLTAPTTGHFLRYDGAQWINVVLANGDISGLSLPAANLTGNIADARVQVSNVTQHQASLSIATTQLTGNMPDARIIATNVTQHQASLAIATTQLTGNMPDARIVQSNVTQHQSAFSIATTQLTGSLPDARVQQSNVTQHQAALAIGGAQVNTDVQEKTASWTLAATEIEEIVKANHATVAIVVTLPGGVFSPGDSVVIIRRGAAAVSFSPGASQTINSPGGTSIAVQHGKACATYVETNVWELSGNV